jgi:hypothetical protein
MILICLDVNWKILFMLRVKLVLCRKYIGRHHRKNSTTIRRVDEPLQALIFDSHYNPFRGIEVIFE